MLNKGTYEAMERIDKLSIELATAFIKSQNIIIAKLQNDIECQKAEIEKLKSKNLVLSQKRNTIDVEEIVKCKDCRHYDKNYHNCNLHSEEPDQYSTGFYFHMNEDDYCSYGERKDG